MPPCRRAPGGPTSPLLPMSRESPRYSADGGGGQAGSVGAGKVRLESGDIHPVIPANAGIPLLLLRPSRRSGMMSPWREAAKKTKRDSRVRGNDSEWWKKLPLLAPIGETSYGWTMKKSPFLLAAAILLASGCHHQATYVEGCGPPPANWITPRQGRGVMSMLNVISVASNGTMSWNGVKVSEGVIGSYLKQTRALDPLPVTHIKFGSGVDCGTVSRLRQLMSETLDYGFGACAEGRGRWWEKSDAGPPFVTYDPHPNLPQD